MQEMVFQSLQFKVYNAWGYDVINPALQIILQHSFIKAQQLLVSVAFLFPVLLRL